ncbi:hypothetical protein DFR68_117112 [Nocardia mexicana]|uniref:Uncharacterized protein n=2 Tax=Nocardia mexicana TaxID=279262 RepID=A0A370GL93_9NOCA|nr:hypothetical protein DFR68_117112 [Nocardia mexicana]
MAWFERWRRSVTFWRVSALVMVGLAQVLNTRYPSVPDVEAWAGDATSHFVSVAVGLEAPPLLDQWLEYATESGLALLLPAVAFLLPRRYARRGVLWSAALLAVLGVVDGYIGKAAIEASEATGSESLFFLSPFYLLAAGALVMSERHTRNASSESD